MLKKMARGFLLLVIMLLGVRISYAQEKAIAIHLFGRDSCPHCRDEKAFLQAFREKEPGVEVYYYELEGDRENLQLLERVGDYFDLQISSVPFTVIGEEYLSGFLDQETSGKKIEELVDKARREGQRDIVSEIGSAGDSPVDKGEADLNKRKSVSWPELKLPIIGKVETKNLSLPLLTFIVALLDGFNPCAMWVLIFLISLLLGLEDRKRMWVLGGVFILTSGLVYFLFLSAWLNLFLFLGFVFWVRLLVGIFALGAGGYYLREWWTNKSGECKVSGGEKRSKVLEKLRNITQRQNLWLALLGIVLLAFAVNLIELVCSAGLPAVYTSVLSISDLPTWQYYIYLWFYIFIFMLDDLLVFGAAMITLRAAGIQTKYARYSHLIGGMVMLFIGIALLFRPELLSFR